MCSVGPRAGQVINENEANCLRKSASGESEIGTHVSTSIHSHRGGSWLNASSPKRSADAAAARVGRFIRGKARASDAGERVQSAAISGNLNLLWRDAGASR